MIEKIKTFFSVFIIIVCLPYLITFVLQGDFSKEPADTDRTSQEDTDLLVRILAQTIPLTSQKAAIQAQAVIARTNLMYAKAHKEAEPEGISGDELRHLWGADYQANYQVLKTCIEDTAGQIAVYKGETAWLPFHAVSAGQTRPVAEKGDKKFGYLQSVKCSKDLKSERFLRILWLSKKQYKTRLERAFPDLEFLNKDLGKTVKVISRDSGDYALSVEVSGKTVSGEEFASAMSLPSACFSIKEIDGQFRIVSKGSGTGVGLSQFGANELAREGKTYKEILKYFYKGISLHKI